MRKTREILRQKWELDRTHRQVAASVGASAGAVAGAVSRAGEAGLDWVAVQALSDDELEARLYPAMAAREGRPLPELVHEMAAIAGYLNDAFPQARLGTSTRHRPGRRGRPTGRALPHAAKGRRPALPCLGPAPARRAEQAGAPSSLGVDLDPQELGARRAGRGLEPGPILEVAPLGQAGGIDRCPAGASVASSYAESSVPSGPMKAGASLQSGSAHTRTRKRSRVAPRRNRSRISASVSPRRKIATSSSAPCVSASRAGGAAK
jgi:hypothetical protein